MLYRIILCGIIGESNIWRFTLKMQLTRLIISSFGSTVWKETHAYSLNGVHLIWQYLHDSTNHHIKAITKYTMYTVYKQKHLGCKKGKANQKQQLSDYGCIHT